MKHETNERKKLVIKDSDITFDIILKKDYIPNSLKAELKKADALIIPYDNYHRFQGPIFPEGTMDFFKYINSLCDKQFSIDICSDDDLYKELILHDNTVNLATILVTGVALPLLLNVIWHYIENTLLKKSREPKIILDIIVQNENISKELHFEGNAEEFRKSIDEITKVSELK